MRDVMRGKRYKPINDDSRNMPPPRPVFEKLHRRVMRATEERIMQTDEYELRIMRSCDSSRRT